MRVILLSRPAIRCTLIATLCAQVLGGAILLTGQPQQLRSISEGVYSVAQATRGQQLYKTVADSALHI